MTTPDAVHRIVELGWTLAWSPLLGWVHDDAVDAADIRGSVTRQTAYRWALHTSSVQSYTPTDLQTSDPLTYMAWCQALGFHPSMSSLRKIPDTLSPADVEPLVPAMVLAFRHADTDKFTWVQDYKRNWAPWLTQRADFDPAVLLGWGRAAPRWLVAFTEGLSKRVSRSKVSDEALWQYAALTDRWPDMPDAVAAALAAHVASTPTTAPIRRSGSPRALLSELVTNVQFASWRDVVRAAFGYSVVICPTRGVVRDYTGAFTGDASAWSKALPRPVAS